MIERLRTAGINDERVLSAFEQVPRHEYVPEAVAARAYDDASLPLVDGQTISQPSTVARMLQFLEIEKDHRVLEVGTGSGFQTALLAKMASQVFSIERIEKLARHARRVLDKEGIYNVNIQLGDGTLGWSKYQPYDRIVVAAAGEKVPQKLIEQLADKGRMMVPVGDGRSQDLFLITKTDGRVSRELIDPCRFVPLIGRGN